MADSMRSRLQKTKPVRFSEKEGFRVVRFWNYDVLANTEGVLEAILHDLQNSPQEQP